MGFVVKNKNKNNNKDKESSENSNIHNNSSINSLTKKNLNNFSKKIDDKVFSIIFFKNFKEFAFTCIYALVLATFIKSVFYENFAIPSSSMNPALLSGDKILVNKFYYGYSKYSFPFEALPIKDRILSNRSPSYGEVVVFKAPEHQKRDIFYIKRVVGLPGDSVIIKKGMIYINGVKLGYEYIEDKGPKEDDNENAFSVRKYYETNLDGKKYNVFIADPRSYANNTQAFDVPQGAYFMMGDNRDNSKDSRFDDMGYIEFKNIVGRADLIYFSASESMFKLWKFFTITRFDRIFTSI